MIRMQLGPRLASCALEIVACLPQASSGLRANSKWAAPLALRRVQRVASGVLEGERADIGEELAEELAGAGLSPAVADLACVVALFAIAAVAAAAWYNGNGKGQVRRWRRQLLARRCCFLRRGATKLFPTNE